MYLLLIKKKINVSLSLGAHELVSYISKMYPNIMMFLKKGAILNPYVAPSLAVPCVTCNTSMFAIRLRGVEEVPHCTHNWIQLDCWATISW